MKNNLFNAIRLQCERKGLSNDLKTLQAKADELNKRAQIAPIGQFQLPMQELRGVIAESAQTKVSEFVTTPTPSIIERCRLLEGLAANVKFPIMRNRASHWANESASTQDYTSVTLTPHRLYSEIVYSDTLIKSTDVTLQNALTQDIVSDIYNKVESTMFSDADATDGNPLGIFNYIIPTELDELSFTNAEKAFYESGAKQPLYIFSPSTYTSVRAAYNDNFKDGKFNDIEYIVTANMQDDCILLCDPNHLIVGLFGAVNIEVDDITKRIEGKVRLIANTYWDWNVTNQNAFQCIKITTE